MNAGNPIHYGIVFHAAGLSFKEFAATSCWAVEFAILDGD